MVATRIQEIRAIKRKPKLTDLLNFFRGRDKDEIREKIVFFFRSEDKKDNEPDLRFDKMNDHFDRLRKSFVC